MRERGRGDAGGRDHWRRAIENGWRYGTNHGAVFSADGKKVFAASRSLALRELDVDTGRFIGRKWKPHKMPVLAMSVDPTGQFLATASADRTIRVWDIQRGYATHIFKGHAAMVTSVQFHETRGF